MSKSKEARGWLLVLSLIAWCCVAADYRTRNFDVQAPTPEIAKQVGDAAEVFRRDLAVEWLGRALPPWSARCPIQVKVGQIGAGGQTSFQFEQDPRSGEVHVFGWNMSIQGSLERILDSVLPHEITHTILACHFRRPLPRWADEGAATLAEHESEKLRQVHTVRQVLQTQHRIPLRKLVDIKDYPKEMRDVFTLYAEGYSVAELLVQKGGKARYLKFLEDALKHSWNMSFKKHYGYKSVEEFEHSWQGWVIAGSPDIKSKSTVIAQNEETTRARPARNRGIVLRGQAPEESSGDSVATAGSFAPPSASSSNLSAPTPRRSGSGRIRRLPTKASPASAAAPSAALGEESAEDDEASHESAPAARGLVTSNTREPAPRAAEVPAASNPGWSTVDEPVNGSSESIAEATPAPSFDREVSSSEGTDAVVTASAEEEVISRDRRARSVQPAVRSPRLAATSARPARKRSTPQWSEFPQIARPSPFTDLPSGSR